ncbi:PEGA domain-containing protein [Candidatus Gottesmanbacteria bacterium]|nr:PEGA domain-containing protein [Candidatus Gottesmanbacteria bacterium]
MFKKIFFITLIIAVGVGLFFGVRFLIASQKQQGQAGLQVKSDPLASVFLDSRFLGRTPYEDRIEPGEYTLKLIPESTATNSASWQGKVVLSSNILTVVNRELGISDLASSGEVITLETLSGKDTEISIVSIPDGATIKIDGTDQGTAPLLLRNVEPGEHEVIISAPGFITRSVKAVATAGFKLSITAQLGISEGGESAAETTPGTTPNITPSATPKATPKPTTTATSKDPEKPFVTILDTPNNFLRVRKEPSTDSEELARVKPDEKYPLTDEEPDWFKIKLSDGTEGWVSAEYAQKTE